MTNCNFRTFVAKSPEDLFAMFLDLRGPGGFVFRGHRDAIWPLQSRLERVYTHPRTRGHVEQRIIKTFKQCAHNYEKELGSNVPGSSCDTLEWLSVMRHYGAPTRLLDFTRSIFVAAYFALLHEPHEKEDFSAIWVVYQGALDTAASRLLFKEKDALAKNADVTGVLSSAPSELRLANTHAITEESIGEFNEEMNRTVVRCSLNNFIRTNGLVRGEPRRFNRRMQFQKGLFIVPTNVRASFQENLEAALDIKVGSNISNECEELKGRGYRSLVANTALIKIIIPKVSFAKFRSTLYQMNLTTDILYPDLEGFILSLHHDGVPDFGSSI